MNWVYKMLAKKSKTTEESTIEEDLEPKDEILLKQAAPAGIGIKRKWVIVGSIITLIFVLFAFLFGLQGSVKKNKRDDTQAKTNNTAVVGNHLKDVPEKYSDVKDSKEAKNSKKNVEKTATARDVETRNVSERPTVPKQPSSNYQSSTGTQQKRQLTPEEKQQLEAYELQQKAYQSPIGFDLK